MCDAAECGILLNRARREIDRLRLGLEDYCSNRPDQTLVVEGDRRDDRRSESADGFRSRPIYAASPIGRIDLAATAKYVSQPVFMNRFLVVTNLGTLVDVLL